MDKRHSPAELFSLLELTRYQLQYGYTLRGIHPNQQSNLAEHHYLVTMIAWHMCQILESKGIPVDTLFVLKSCLVHDIRELFGGDISWQYALQNPAAKQLATEFEASNYNYMLQKFGPAESEMSELSISAHPSNGSAEITLELAINKLADYIECLQYLLLVGKLDTESLTETQSTAEIKVLMKVAESPAKEVLTRLFIDWILELSDKLKNQKAS